MKFFKTIFFFLFLLYFSSHISGKGVELVRNGAAVAEIVLHPEANASMRNAAADIREFVKLISDAELPIVESPGADAENRIFVGSSEHTETLGFVPTEFNSSGYEIYVRENYIIIAGMDRLSKHLPYGMTIPDSQYLRGAIPEPENFPSERLQAWWDFCGEPFTTWQIDLGGKGGFSQKYDVFKNDDTGTWYAAIELLEQLGVRFYAPYDDGTVIPRENNLKIAAQHLKREAAFGRREWHYRVDSNEDSLLWFKRQKSGTFAPIIYNHTTVAIYASIIQHKNHPEYLACDENGKPFRRDYAGIPPHAGGIPRYTNPGFRQASVLLMNKLFEASPELYAVSLGAPDGGAAVDPRDLAVYGNPDDTREQKAANYVWDYQTFLARELKKSNPDKFLIYSAPGGARIVPTNIQPDDPDNMIFGLAQPYSAYRVLEETNQQALDFRRKWFEAYKPRGKSPVWDYFLYYRTINNPRYPVFFTRSLQEEMQEMLPYSDGKFIEVSIAGQSAPGGLYSRRIAVPALAHLMINWQSKLFWNPDADREAFLEEYYRLYFGPAAAEMRTYHEFAEEVWCRQESRSVTSQSGFLRGDDVEQYFALLTKARLAAGSDTIFERRIAAIEEQLSPLKRQFASLQRKGPIVHIYTPARYKVDFTHDGNLEKPFWTHFRWWPWHQMRDVVTGDIPLKNATHVALRRITNPPTLIIGAICHESDMDKLHAVAEGKKARGIRSDDHLEIIIASAERSFFRILVNPLGAVWEECHDPTLVDRDTLPELWDPGIEVQTRREADRWTVELCIPMADFGSLGPTANYRWGINVGRVRRAGGAEEWYAISPTGAHDFSDLSKLGDVAVGDEAKLRIKEKSRMSGYPERFQTALSLLKEKQLQEAEQAFLQLAEEAPDNSSRIKSLGKAALARAGRGEEESENAMAMLKGVTDSPEGAFAYMQLLNSLRKSSVIAEHFSEADLHSWPDSFSYRAFALRGTARFSTRDSKGGASDLAESMKLSGSDLDNKFITGNRAAATFLAGEETEKAQKIYRELIQTIRNNPRLQSHMRGFVMRAIIDAANLYVRLGDTEEARRTISLMGEGKPDEAKKGDWWCQILETRGDIELAEGHPEKALLHYREALTTEARASFLQRMEKKLKQIAPQPD